MRAALTAQDNSAIIEQLHTAMEGLGTDEESIFVALQRLDRDPAKITALEAAYRAKYRSELVDDIHSEMSGSELALALELLGTTAAGATPAIAPAAPATQADLDAAARRLHAAMVGLGTDEEAVYSTLIPFNRDSGKLSALKSSYQALFSASLEDDIKDDFSGTELTYALYLLNAPPPDTPHAEVAVLTPGPVAHTGATEGGTVTPRTGASFTVGAAAYPQGFSIGYQGGLAPDSHWLQFIWRELIVTHPARGTYRVSQSITTSGGTYNLTTDLASPNYNTDSASPTNPFYEGAFADNRTADSTTIYDMPAPMQAAANAQFAAGATSVVSRAHFNTYLVRDFRTLYHVALDVEWTFTGAAVPPRVQSVHAAGPVRELPSDMKRRLVAQYPQFDYIQ